MGRINLEYPQDANNTIKRYSERGMYHGTILGHATKTYSSTPIRLLRASTDPRARQRHPSHQCVHECPKLTISRHSPHDWSNGIL